MTVPMSERDEHDFWIKSVRRENLGKFCSNINQFKENKNLTNVTIVCRDSKEEFNCHIIVLAAVSEHFERIFEQRTENDNKPIRLDATVAEFTYVMKFAYEGSVQIDDKNVFILLHLSYRFKMKVLENWCIRYLAERNIPTDDALALFAFACDSQITALIRPLARFILNNLPEVAKGEAGLRRFDLGKMRALLAHWEKSSLGREDELLTVLSHWISHSGINLPDPSGEDLPTEFSKKLQFGHCSKDDVKIRLQTSCNLNLDKKISSKPRKSSSLYMYIRNSPPDQGYSIYSCSETSEESFTLIKLHNRVAEHSANMKIVGVNNGQLYSCFYEGGNSDNSRFTFSRYSSVNLSDQESLRTPEGILPQAPGHKFSSSDFDSLHACSDPISQRIYLSHNFYPTLESYRKLSMYVCDIDQWNPVFDDCDLNNVVMMSCSDSRLYMLGPLKALHAYDYRAGKCEKLADSKSFSFSGEDCCCHKGKLYKTFRCSSDEGHRGVRLEVYDPVAGSWSELTSNPEYQPLNVDVRLVSYDNRLWMVGRSTADTHQPATGNQMNRHYYIQRYDSFLQNWDGETSMRIGLSNSISDIIVFDS